MNGSSSTHSNESSGPLLIGIPSIVDHLSDLVANYKSALEVAIEYVAKEEQDAVQQKAMASDSGWADLATAIKVQYSKDSHGLDYSVSTKNSTDAYKAQTLEFGDNMNPASPLLRSSAARTKDTFDKRVSEKVNELLGGGR